MCTESSTLDSYFLIMKYHFNTRRLLLLSLTIIMATVMLSSCGKDDEPSSTIDYYIEVEEQFLVNGAVDHTDRYYSPVTMMKEVIRNVYPEPNAIGDDDAVIKACDELQERYISMYKNKGEHLTCLMHLVRAHKSGDIVKESERIKTYNIDINPPEEEITD